MQGLKYKIILLIIFPLAFVFIMIGYLTITNKSDTEQQLVLNRITAYRGLLESGDVSLESLQDRKKLEDFLGEKVIYAEIVRPDYSLIYTTENAPLTRATDQDKRDINEAFAGIETVKKSVIEGKLAMVYISPLVVNDQIVAVINSAISYAYSDQIVKQYALFTIGLMMVGLLVCMLLIIWLLKRIVLNNISMLKAATDELRKGNFNIPLKITSNDEIGDLSEAFVHMREDLKQSHDELRKANIFLEDQVSERTAELEDEQRRVKSSWNFLNGVVNAVSDPIFVKDEQHRWVRINTAFAEFVGKKPEDILGKFDRDVFPKERADIFWAEDERILKTGADIVREEQVVEAGIKRTIVAKKSIYVDLQGNKFIVGVIRDISDRKKIEDTLQHTVNDLKKTETELLFQKATIERKVLQRTKELETAQQELKEALQSSMEDGKRIRAILHSIGDGVFVLDKDKKIVLSNPITEALSGYSRPELLGTVYNKHLQFMYEDNQKENTSFIDRVYEEGVLSSMKNHTYLIRKDGSKLPVADSAAPLKDQQGTVIGAVVVFRDVTKEREVERMKDEFISIASHQLRTPLTAIRWSTEILENEMKKTSNDEQSTLVTDIRDSTKRLIQLVNDLLNITRIESGRIIIEPVETDIGDLIKSVMEEVKIRYADRKQRYIITIAKNIPKIQIDQKLIRQAVLNIMTNACKYSPNKSTISVSVIQDLPWITVEVKDEGYGIPKEAQSKLFQKFYRASNILQKDSDGSGLGLYLVEKIMEASGGRIRLHSEVDKGSTFWLDMPVSGSEQKQGEVQLS